MFPFTAFTHVCATPQCKIPMYACTQQQKKALIVFICWSDQKHCDPVNTLRVHCVMRGISYFPIQKRWHHWSHLMCALNIRWGCKGSIQEFSTLLRAPGLPSPSQPSQATLRTRTGWNRPLQQQHHKQPQLQIHWLETKQRMIARAEPCLRPLGCSHSNLSAPPCAAHLLKDSFHRNPTKSQVNRLLKRLSQMRHGMYLLDPLAPKIFLFQYCNSSTKPSPASFTHTLFPLTALYI